MKGSNSLPPKSKPTLRVRRVENRKHAEIASKAMAALYTWANIQAILESGSDPGRLDAESEKAVTAILKIVRQQQQNALRVYDNAIKRIKL